MPRWARFLSCTLTATVLSLSGFFSIAYWSVGHPGYWPGVMDFAATPAFWYLVLLFGTLGALGLVFARFMVHMTHAGATVAGLASGTMVGLAYAAFLIAIHAHEWGGIWSGITRTWPEWALFLVPVAAACGFTSWLWERLD